MSPKVYAAFLQILTSYYQERQPHSALEIGASKSTLLAIPCLSSARKVALNMKKTKIDSSNLKHLECVIGNSNSLEFAEGEFDCILSSSVLEHDKFFWKSVAEIHRVLRSGGIFVVGVPIYMTLPTDYMNTTLTFKRHGISYNADFYRFSEQAVREVILENFQIDKSILVRKYPNPYLVMSGIKR